MRLRLVLAFVLTASLSTVGEDLPSPEALANRAIQVSALSQDGSTPYKMTISFRALHLKDGDLDGTEVRYWKSPKELRIEDTLGTLKIMDVRNVGQSWHPPDVNFYPLSLTLLGTLIDRFQVEHMGINDKFKTKKRRISGREAYCAELKDLNRESVACFDAQSGVLLHYESMWGGFANVTRESAEFSDYTAFGNKLFPRKMTLARGEKTLIEATIESVQDWSPDPAMLTAPAGYVARRICDLKLLKPPRPTQHPDPHYPDGGIGSAMPVVQVLLDEKGNVRDSQIQYSAGAGFDDEALKAVKNWKFMPATCDGEPIELPVSVQVLFHRR